jgi:hypothetical protein
MARWIAPAVLILVALAIMIPGVGPDLVGKLWMGTVEAIDETLGLDADDWRDVQWPEGVMWRALQRACLETTCTEAPSPGPLETVSGPEIS